MYLAPANLPREVLERLARAWRVPRYASWEHYGGAGVDCRICREPVAPVGSNDGSHSLVLAQASSEGAVEQFVGLVENLIRASAMRIPGLRVMKAGEVAVLTVPWSYRGELRAAARSSLAPSALALKVFMGHGEDGVDSTSGMDRDELKKQLYAFATTPSRWSTLRRLVRSLPAKTYCFPFNSQLHELDGSNGIIWSLGFSDVDDLERAQVIMNAAMDKLQPTCLMAADTISNDAVDDSLLEEIVLWAQKNTLQARMELAKLLKHLFLAMDRYSFEASVTDPAALAAGEETKPTGGTSHDQHPTPRKLDELAPAVRGHRAGLRGRAHHV